MEDKINPLHYKDQPVETIEKMRRIWGDKRVAEYCEIVAFKYRDRAGRKDCLTIEEDIKKALWYEDMMDLLMEKSQPVTEYKPMKRHQKKVL